MENYKIYQSDLIRDNHSEFVFQCHQLNNRLKGDLSVKDTTWEYYKYNVFGMTSASILFYRLYKDLNSYIRDFIKDDQPLWFQSWLNYHEDNIVDKSLKWHGHHTLFHGYISIDPQNTITEFRNGLKLENKPGQIYIGPGNNYNLNNHKWDHRVISKSPSSLPRITIAFDITNKKDNIIQPNFFPLL